MAIFAAEPEALGAGIRKRVAGAWPELAASVARSEVQLPQLTAATMAAGIDVDSLDLEQLKEVFSGALSALQESVDVDQDLLDKEFQGNIATAPMRSPF